MSNISNDTPEVFEESLSHELRKRVNKEHLDISSTKAADIFKDLIEALHDKYNKRVVVLIDEYDKPILDHLLDVEKAEANRVVIRGYPL